MYKMPKKDDDEKLTVSKIYETLKSRQFLKSLYWDALSDLKEKPTYKRMNETIKKIVNEKLQTIEALPGNEPDTKFEKSTVNELCSLAVTVDTVYSKILYTRLERGFNSLIFNIIKDLRNKGDIPDDVWAELEILSDDDVNVKNTNDVSAKLKTETPSPSMPVKKGVQKIMCNEKKKLKNQKSVRKNGSENEKKLAQKKRETRSHAYPKKTYSKFDNPKTSPISSTSTPKKHFPSKNNSKDDEIEIDVVNLSPNEKKESDTDSNKSIGGISLTSISSVHTSDLSSYDDEISISSGDGTRLRVPVDEVLAETIAGKINGIKKTITRGQYRHQMIGARGSRTMAFVRVHSNDPRPGNHTPDIPRTDNHIIEASEVQENSVVSENPEIQISVETTDKPDESATTSSKRIRKPNFKYSSDSVICHSVKVKDRKKPASASDVDEKNPGEISPKRKRSCTEIETPNKIQKTNNDQETTLFDDKASTSKQNESADLLKPPDSSSVQTCRISSVRSLTSRKTAPVTLFASTPISSSESTNIHKQN